MLFEIAKVFHIRCGCWLPMGGLWSPPSIVLQYDFNCHSIVPHSRHIPGAEAETHCVWWKGEDLNRCQLVDFHAKCGSGDPMQGSRRYCLSMSERADLERVSNCNFLGASQQVRRVAAESCLA